MITLLICQHNHAIPISSHMTSTLGHMTSTLGHMTSTLGHMTSPLGHIASTLGHITSNLGHMTSTLGHMTSTLGHMTSTLGHMTSFPPCLIGVTYRTCSDYYLVSCGWRLLCNRGLSFFASSAWSSNASLRGWMQRGGIGKVDVVMVIEIGMIRDDYYIDMWTEIRMSSEGVYMCIFIHNNCTIILYQRIYTDYNK